MSNLSQFMDYKNKIINLLISNDTIIKLINNTDISVPEDLIYENIFPKYKIPSTEDTEKTYICIEVFTSSITNDLIEEVTVDFSVFSHVNLLKTDNNYVRTDKLSSEIDKMFNHSSNIGKIGFMTLVFAKPLVVSDKYYGNVIRYKVTDFNRIKGLNDV
jgi:hypothetical protein